MPHSFQIIGLDHEPFEPLFELSIDELKNLGAVRRVADEPNSFPCRVSLEDAQVGEELILVPYVHQAAASPYRASGPIFIRRSSRQASVPKDFVPPYVTRRLISVRGYDEEHMLVQAAVVDGQETKAVLESLFESSQISYVHLHNAKQGCFSCRVDRA